MLDRKYIVDNADQVIRNCTNRGVSCDVPKLVELETARRQCLINVEELNRQANERSKLIGKAKDNDEREKLKEEGRKLREQKEAAQAEHHRLETPAHALHLVIPNMTHPSAPVGGEHDAAEVALGVRQALALRHAAEMGADADGDEPVFLALLGAVGIGRRCPLRQ